MLTPEDKVFYQLAQTVAWSPCKHFSQCVGFCPLCLRDYLKPTPKKPIIIDQKVGEA